MHTHTFLPSMGFHLSSSSSSSSSLVSYTLTKTHAFSTKPSPFSLKPTICCSLNEDKTQLSSSSRNSYSRKWYNPLRNRNLQLDDSSPQLFRHWVESDQTFDGQEKFTVVSYNILGDRNASKHRDMYSNVPSWYMTWGRRKRVICEELMGWNPHIICLQEVDRYFDLSSTLEKAGYVGSYKRRTGDNADGCAVFWRDNKFRLLEAESIEFKRYGLRDNVAQLLVFEMCNAESRRLLIGNIHVLYNPSRGEIKLGQIRLLSTKAHALSERWGNIPVLLAGDFNTTPQSPIYEFLSKSELNILSHNRKELSGQRSCHPAQVFGVRQDSANAFLLMDRLLTCDWTNEEIRAAGGDTESGVIDHPLKLKSSYVALAGPAEARDLTGEPLATSYHLKFIGTVDYIWYTEGLEPVRVLDVPPFEKLRRTGGLPCKKVGSDHLALVSEFAFTQVRNAFNNLPLSHQ